MTTLYREFRSRFIGELSNKERLYMVFIHFLVNNSKVLTQLLNSAPSVDESIKIKGRQGKITKVEQIKDNVIHAHVLYDPVIKKKQAADPKKKKR